MKDIKKILVVDDEPVITRACSRVLEDCGFEVVTSGSATDGLEQASTKDFDLVITDLRMPDLDGMELVRRIKGLHPETAIMIITGYGSSATAIEAIKLGVCDYIEKPFSSDQIACAVKRALGTGRQAVSCGRTCIEADLVHEVLNQAATDPGFSARLSNEGSRVLSGLALSSEAKAAIVSGDLVWIEKKCGDLSEEEKSWIEKTLQSEKW